MGADLLGPVFETQSADVLIVGEVSKLIANIELNKLVRWEVEAGL